MKYKVKVKNKTQNAGISGQEAVGSRQKSEIERQRTEGGDSPVGAAFPVLSSSKDSRDLDWDFTDFNDLNDLNEIGLYVIKTLPESDGVKNPCR